MSWKLASRRLPEGTGAPMQRDFAGTTTAPTVGHQGMAGMEMPGQPKDSERNTAAKGTRAAAPQGRSMKGMDMGSEKKSR